MRSPGTDAGNEAAILAHVVGNVIGTENDGDVEVGEENDAHDVEQLVPGFAGAQTVENAGQEAAVAHEAGAGKEQRGGENRAGEDDRHDAAGVDLERQVGGLTAHQAAADDALGVLHRDAPLAALDKDDEGHDGDHDHDQQDQRRDGEGSPGLGACLVDQVLNAAGQADHDAGEDQQAHAVADAAVGNLLAQPHDEGGAGGQRDHGHQDEAESGVQDVGDAARAVGEGQGDGQRLHDCPGPR